MNLRLGCSALASCLALGASVSARADAEHDSISAERAAAKEKLASRQRECEARFVVAPCLEEARNENRAALSMLRQRELQLDESRRRADAEARRKAIAERAEARQAHASEATPEPPQVRVRRGPEPADSKPEEKADASASRRSNHAGAGESRLMEQQNIERFEARQRDAQAHREAVERRNAERAGQGKAASPLPPGGDGRR